MAFFKRWQKPSKRAKSYAQERKAKVHQHGQKEGKPLTDYESGLRSGYLQCQTDHAEMYKFIQSKKKDGTYRPNNPEPDNSKGKKGK